MLKDIVQERIKKRDSIISAGYNAYPSNPKRTHLIKKVLRHFLFLSLFKNTVAVSGRIFGLRAQGGVMFVDLKDESGRIQAVLVKKSVKNFDLWKNCLDIGDFITVKGRIFKTKKGEKSVKVQELEMAAKSLRPLPSEWYGLKDIEERYRKRYLDLILNGEIKDKIQRRSLIIQELREILKKDGFLEVETPMLQPIAGGAIARPFKTHHNALNEDFYLRVAPELYLKRLLVGGFEKIFEIGRNFRNEGIDREHNPEFTMLELYWAYQDYKGLMAATQKWFLAILDKLRIKTAVYQGIKLNLCSEWKIEDYQNLVEKHTGKKMRDLNMGKIDEIFKKEVRPKLIEPTLVIKYPKAISPLAKSCPDNPDFTERFQLVIAGMEIANGYSELNDPEEQRRRMEEQEKMHRSGNEEASRLDEDYLEALEYGMPPAAGLGIGVDRLVSLLTDSHSVKEIIIFPTLRPLK
ncbi:MAG: lysine--tRNA ligase [Candidatus Harrisonbacteria bacterium RIFCSPHIGHO2_02_FULL_42_16]|uniref:Lysine--tRNA ligase n=1 Tax=Candidatus Harrisonbacteria bacterium RIFCSPHIGHO2_02_FULL_42_16 TaxID=1798404 RepID=A0A1G1ZKS3_9BACT|nr:MAG: lysine--tRNA ligase [Candidatus Harrisonbacteria bacterium RIFCSPHIGHO2_02_FULL_42_16]